jgi:beta-galactosidase
MHGATDECPAAFMPTEGLHFMVSQYSVTQVLAARHEHELEPGSCRLHIDGFHMGVGGDDSWTPSVRDWQVTRSCFGDP